MPENEAKTPVCGLGGQFVTFTLGDEEYGVEILKVQEIIGLPPVTRVPHLPQFTKGVINLRGAVVPVVDLRLRFNLDLAEYNDRTCVIITKVSDRVTGMIVDVVSEVAEIPDDLIDPTPSFNSQIRTDFIKGVGKIDKRLVILLDVDRLLTDEELKSIKSITEERASHNEVA